MAEGAVVDVAGGPAGGAARIRGEFMRYLEHSGADGVRVIGSGRYLTVPWLIRRELEAGTARRRVALFNAAFMTPGGPRVTVLQNAFHFLTSAEKPRYRGVIARSVHAQALVVRHGVRVSDVVVAPCSEMADRVVRVVPQARDRMVVRFNPIAPDSYPDAGGERDPAILCPVILYPYKRLDERIAQLVAALDALDDVETKVRVTADLAELPPALAAHPRVVLLGRLPFAELRTVWARSRAIYFPTDIEAFGYPLGEARLSGHPVIAHDTSQSREIAGPALCGYTDFESLCDAVATALATTVVPDPVPFDPTAYFSFLIGRDGSS